MTKLRCCYGLILPITLFALLGTATGQSEIWMGTWAHVPTAYNLSQPAISANGVVRRPAFSALPPYQDVTVREIVRLSTSSERIRVRFSNEYGVASIHLADVHLALAGEDGLIVPGSDHAVTFSGHSAVEIPPGAPTLSDPVDWNLPSLAELAVSVYYPNSTIPPAHSLFAIQAYVSSSGDFSGAETMPGAVPARTGNAISEIDVVSTDANRVLIALGDSITEGVSSTPGAFHTWPDRLAERLQRDTSTRRWSILNAGIGSNRLLYDTPGANALARFDRDVLSVPGVSAVVLMEGINDIQYSHRNPVEAVAANDIIAAYRQIIARAHSHGIKVFGATITPFGNTPDFTEQGEAIRQAVNQWIRTGGEFDGVIDFDVALRDPSNPSELRVDLSSKDHLHPNDAGYEAMADCINLSLLA
jgi:lysophospholipase L1-like esterase